MTLLSDAISSEAYRFSKNRMTVYNISLPTAVLIWLMIYPMMLQIDFGSIKRVSRNPKGLLITLIVNWAVKPFTMFALALLFFTRGGPVLAPLGVGLGVFLVLAAGFDLGERIVARASGWRASGRRVLPDQGRGSVLSAASLSWGAVMFRRAMR